MNNEAILSPSKSEKQEFYRLPKSGERDPFFGCTRSWYYSIERQGLIKFKRVRRCGNLRGLVFIPYDAVHALIEAGN